MPELPADVRVALYRIAQEALNNVAKHSGARHASVGLTCEDGAVRLTIADDGSGFDTVAPSGQLGLGIMRERADAVGAALDLRSAPGQGTTVTVTWSPPPGDRRHRTPQPARPKPAHLPLGACRRLDDSNGARADAPGGLAAGRAGGALRAARER